MTEWVKCSERLPDIGKLVLIVIDSSNVDAGRLLFEDNRPWFFSETMMISNVTHWAELPKPPTS